MIISAHVFELAVCIVVSGDQPFPLYTNGNILVSEFDWSAFSTVHKW